MKTQITMDSAGRVLIPKSLREKFQLRPGDELELESQGEDITLRPQKVHATMTKEHGIWVFHGEPADIDICDLIRQQREDRIRHVAGLDSE
ncbi:MAG: AbrB/MazE/SpoVT family DNA-binding domain-containing protein [Bryobacteraceae bacterium]